MDWWWIKIRSLHEAEDWVRPSLETEQNTLNNSLNLHCCRRWQSLQWIFDSFPCLFCFQYFGFSAVANIFDPLSISILPFPCHVLPFMFPHETCFLPSFRAPFRNVYLSEKESLIILQRHKEHSCALPLPFLFMLFLFQTLLLVFYFCLGSIYKLQMSVMVETVHILAQ